jgi:hypothetical protein
MWGLEDDSGTGFFICHNTLLMAEPDKDRTFCRGSGTLALQETTLDEAIATYSGCGLCPTDCLGIRSVP